MRLSTLQRLGGLACVALLLGGCAGTNPYLDAKRNTAAGGQQSRDIAAARGDLQTVQVENVRLADEKTRRQADIERNSRRIRALEADLRTQDAALANALKARQLTQARHNELKREMDALRAETQTVELQNRGDALTAADSRADAAKEAKLKDLERRKKDLETALSALAKR